MIAVGASAGGVEALTRLVSQLPGDLPATLLVVLHLPSGGKSLLQHILNRAGPLEALQAEDGRKLELGKIFVAPPDHHLTVEDSRMRVTPGPKENGHRPAIDPLFRSAAAAVGSRLVAVVLSGVLDDGTAGLDWVRRRKGVTVVQDPDDALYPSMPLNALAAGHVEHVLAVDKIAHLLAVLAQEEVQHLDDAAPMPMPPDDPRSVEDEIVLEAGASGFVCPECGGALWEEESGELPRFQCRVGHAYSAVSMMSEQGATLEAALWTANRALEERAALARKLGRRMHTRGQSKAANRFAEREAEAVGHAQVLRDVLLSIQRAPQAAEAFEETAADHVFEE